MRGTFGKAALATAALSGLLFFAGAPSAKAADRDDDHRRVATSERRFSDEDGGIPRARPITGAKSVAKRLNVATAIITTTGTVIVITIAITTDITAIGTETKNSIFS